MPYIKQELRDELDGNINSLSQKIVELNVQDHAGLLNYTINKLVQEILMHRTKSMSIENARYADWNEVIGALECCKIEIYRRLIAPYEDKKIKQNGDV